MGSSLAGQQATPWHGQETSINLAGNIRHLDLRRTAWHVGQRRGAFVRISESTGSTEFIEPER